AVARGDLRLRGADLDHPSHRRGRHPAAHGGQRGPAGAVGPVADPRGLLCAVLVEARPNPRDEILAPAGGNLRRAPPDHGPVLAALPARPGVGGGRRARLPLVLVRQGPRLLARPLDGYPGGGVAEALSGTAHVTRFTLHVGANPDSTTLTGPKPRPKAAIAFT